MIDFLIFFGCLLITIIVHEMGHLFVALFYKIKVEIFSIGFGKTLFSKKIKGIDYRISLIPFGGYIQLKGEKNKSKNGFLSQRYRNKLMILLAGVGVNCALGIICSWINYGNIFLGIKTDLQFLYYIFTKQDVQSIILFLTIKPNIILLQLSLLNFSVVIFNLLPFPCLDGGQCIYLWIEKFYKTKFIKIYEQLNHYGFWFLIWLQVFLVYLYWIIP